MKTDEISLFFISTRDYIYVLSMASIGLLLLHDLVSSLDLFILSKLRSGGLDNTNSNGLPHVTNSEHNQRWELGKASTHGLAGVQDEDSGITRDS